MGAFSTTEDMKLKCMEGGLISSDILRLLKFLSMIGLLYLPIYTTKKNT